MVEAAQGMQAITSTRRDWPGAVRAMRALLADPDDTVQVFKVMAALNGGSSRRNYRRLIETAGGGRIAYARVELIEKLTDPAWLAQFATGTVGAAYRAFLEKTGFSANGLAEVSQQVHRERPVEHPYAWFGRRERDIHDIWHVLTGYRANDPLGELCLVAFSYAQTKGLGWGFIALSGGLQALGETQGWKVIRAIREGYRHGRAAAWLHADDIEALFAEPLEAARKRLKIAKPVAYLAAREALLAAQPEPAAAH
ncbi:MAG TPA: Coq4 family protein [Rhizomicrobium sp.]|nr:Coq4 family protein [Rhizomicrobium sp.]